MSNNELSPAGRPADERESSNSTAAQRARLLGAFEMRIPVSTELAKTVFGIRNLGGRLQELRRMGWSIKTWRGLAKNTAGRAVAVFGLYPPTESHAALIRAAHNAATAEGLESDQDDGGGDGPQ